MFRMNVKEPKEPGQKEGFSFECKQHRKLGKLFRIYVIVLRLLIYFKERVSHMLGPAVSCFTQSKLSIRCSSCLMTKLSSVGKAKSFFIKILNTPNEN